MESSEALKQLINIMPEAIHSVSFSYGCESLTVKKESIRQVILNLKENHGFVYLTDLCGAHYPERENPFEVIYHLHNLEANRRLRLKVQVGREPEIESICDIFSAANWMERETYDFYGIKFSHHPNLIRILNVEYLDYFPLRKEFPLEDPTREDKDDRFFGREKI
jgi:NADH-quinone oxidoreductase subunit C